MPLFSLLRTQKKRHLQRYKIKFLVNDIFCVKAVQIKDLKYNNSYSMELIMNVRQRSNNS